MEWRTESDWIRHNKENKMKPDYRTWWRRGMDTGLKLIGNNYDEFSSYAEVETLIFVFYGDVSEDIYKIIDSMSQNNLDCL